MFASLAAGSFALRETIFTRLAGDFLHFFVVDMRAPQAGPARPWAAGRALAVTPPGATSAGRAATTANPPNTSRVLGSLSSALAGASVRARGALGRRLRRAALRALTCARAADAPWPL